MIRPNPSVSMSAIGRSLDPTWSMAMALFTRESSRPVGAAAAAISSRTLPSSVTSAWMNRACPPLSVICCSICRPWVSLRPVSTTLAPSAANRSAMAAPKPFVEPVTSTDLPCRRPVPASAGWVCMPEPFSFPREPGRPQRMTTGGRVRWCARWSCRWSGLPAQDSLLDDPEAHVAVAGADLDEIVVRGERHRPGRIVERAVDAGLGLTQAQTQGRSVVQHEVEFGDVAPRVAPADRGVGDGLVPGSDQLPVRRDISIQRLELHGGQIEVVEEE